jgi:hypothetical protein
VVLLAALVLGLLAGVALARGLKRPYRLPDPRHLWLVPAAFLPQLLVVYLPVGRGMEPVSAASAALPVSLVVFLVFVWLNRRIPGMLVMLVGLVLNLLVITANGGWMPISPQTASQLPGGAPPSEATPGIRVGDKDILLRPEDTRLEMLADRFLLPEWLGYRAAYSLGDVFAAAGAFLLLASPPIMSNLINGSKNADN